MANEAVIIELFNGGRPMRFTCADGTGIAKGGIMELDGDRTVIIQTNAAKPIVGIAAHEKVASDGSTEISVYTDGVFDILTDTGTDAAGVLMANDGTANTAGTADAADILAGATIGHLLETAGNAEVAAIRVNK